MMSYILQAIEILKQMMSQILELLDTNMQHNHSPNNHYTWALSKHRVLAGNKMGHHSLKLCHRAECQWLQGCCRFDTTQMDNNPLKLTIII
jgi:hypothetical protein